MKTTGGRQWADWSSRLIWAFGIGGFLLARTLIPWPSPDQRGWVVPLSLFPTLLHAILILLLSATAGDWLLQDRLPATRGHALMRMAWAATIGLGLLSLALSLLAFIGLLTAITIAALLSGLGAAFGPRSTKLAQAAWRNLREAARNWRLLDGIAKAGILALLGLGMLSLLNALVPPWAYDALMYHLPGPLKILETGGFSPHPDNWYVNGPFSIELLFAVGLAFRDDILPKLIHWIYGALYLLGTMAFAERWFGRRVAWLAGLVLLGIPILPMLAGFAYIDLGWATYEFLGLAALLTWRLEDDRRWLPLGGLAIGLALSSKYLGLMGLATFGILFFMIAPWRKGFPAVLRAGLQAIWPMLVALPWYVRNLIWFGNPVFPLYFGGPGWGPERLRLYHAYLDSFGAGRSLLDILLLPLNVYRRNSLFGAVINRNDIPGPLFPLMLLLPFLPRPKALRLLLIGVLIRAGLWALGSHQIRFLLPVYPGLAIATAYVLNELPSKFQRIKTLRFGLTSLAVALIFIPAFYQIQVMRTYDTLRALAGAISRQDFLERAVGDYGASQFIRRSLPPAARVPLIGNGRSYYCSPKCIPDPDHFRWSSELMRLETPMEVCMWARALGASHLMASIEDLDFLLQHDPLGVVQEAVMRLGPWKDSGVLKPVYSDDWAEIYRLECQTGDLPSAPLASPLQRSEP